MNNKKLSKKREVGVAKQIGGRAQPGSGCFWSKKGDITSEHFLIEDKFTHSSQYSVSIKKLFKIEKESLRVNKIPVFRFGFYELKHDYVVIDLKYIVESIPCKDIFTTKYDSYLFKDSWLQSIFLASREISLAIIHFNNYNRNFMVLEWNTFIENQNKFLSL